MWAPDKGSLRLIVTPRDGARRRLELERNEEGYWSTLDPQGRAGDRYQYQLPDGRLLPDPASRYQPEGVHGPSECVDSHAYSWHAAQRERPAWRGQPVYELHLGCFSEEGTYRGAMAKIDHLCDLGFEMVQIMPIADFPGERNWGYDGAALYAPARCYGHPDELRALIDAMHKRGLSVILDVVYNHIGAHGNYLGAYCDDYFSNEHHTPWGSAFNLHGPRAEHIAAFLVGNATYWMDEFRFDGLRLDATHAIPRSDPHLVAQISDAVHARGGFVIAEDERNQADFFEGTDSGGFGLDSVWADDLHHQLRVAMTGERRSYYSNYSGTAADVADALEHGWSYRGQGFASWNGKPRGTESKHIPPSGFVVCIENHDQVGNRPKGERLEHLVRPEIFRAATLLLCLSPYTPLFFMGQEWAASSPFQFFTDHEAGLGKLVTEGRRREFGFDANSTEVPDPQDRETFLRSKLKWDERWDPFHGTFYLLTKEGLALRSQWRQGEGLRRGNWKVKALGEIVVLRYVSAVHDQLLLLSFGNRGLEGFEQEEILKAPEESSWVPVLHSNEARFGGIGPADAPLAFRGPACALFSSRKAD